MSSKSDLPESDAQRPFRGGLSGPGGKARVDRKGPSSVLQPASLGIKDGSESVPEVSRDCVCFERHYEPAELGALWGLSPDEIRRIFQNEPGVLVIENNGPMRGKRRYRTLRIPESVVVRVHQKRSVAKGERFPLTGQTK